MPPGRKIGKSTAQTDYTEFTSMKERGVTLTIRTSRVYIDVEEGTGPPAIAKF
jgi:hypothetical protein